MLLSVGITSQLLKHGAEPNQEGSIVDPLVAASRKGNLAVCTLLLNYNAEIDALAPDGNTALHAAVAEGNQIIVTLLLDRNAEIQVKNGAGKTSLDIATEEDLPIIKTILSVALVDDKLNFPGRFPLHSAIRLNLERRVRRLLNRDEYRKAIESRNENGETGKLICVTFGRFRKEEVYTRY